MEKLQGGSGVDWAGFFGGPTLRGLVSENAGLRVAFLAIAVLMTLMLPWVLLLKQQGKGQL